MTLPSPSYTHDPHYCVILVAVTSPRVWATPCSGKGLYEVQCSELLVDAVPCEKCRLARWAVARAVLSFFRPEWSSNG